jgi:hypothetical protein
MMDERQFEAHCAWAQANPKLAGTDIACEAVADLREQDGMAYPDAVKACLHDLDQDGAWLIAVDGPDQAIRDAVRYQLRKMLAVWMDLGVEIVGRGSTVRPLHPPGPWRP